MGRENPGAGERMLIGRNGWDVPVRVELRAYLRFSRRIDSQLRRLVVRWAHTAASESRAMTLKPPDTSNKEHRPTG